jgi:hypothetical protein
MRVPPLDRLQARNGVYAGAGVTSGLVQCRISVGSVSVVGLGRVKTKFDLIVASSGRPIFVFFALRMTTGLKISGAVIPRSVFTQPGSKREFPHFGLMSASSASSRHWIANASAAVCQQRS